MRRYFIGSLILLIILNTGILTLFFFLHTRGAAQRLLERQIRNIEEMVANRLSGFDTLLNPFEEEAAAYNERALREIYRRLQSLSEHSPPRLSRQELTELTSEFPEVDIYVIDAEGVVVASSLEQDIGLDLPALDPEFSDFLQAVYGSGTIATQRIAPSNMTGTKMIYSYFSPKGGSWILESSVDFEGFMARRYSQRLYRYLFEEYFRQIEREHNNLRHFDLIHRTKLSSRSLLTGEVVPITADIRQALIQRDEVRRRGEAILVYRRFDMEALQYDFVKEAIVRFEYDLSYYHSFMRRLYLISIGAALGLILLLTLLAYVLVERTFVRRFAQLREVIAAAAEGNYRPRVKFTSRISEMQNLAAATNKLIETVAAREADLRASLDERESLLNEIHHRVKNNLNVVVSLLNLQAQQFSTLEEAQRAFSNTYNRIYTMALTHEMLYQSDNLSEIPMREYLETFLARFQQDGGGAAQRIRTRTRVENVALDIGYAVPCGIIINELLTNAFTHAFPEGRTGTVEIELHHISAREFQLSVADDGIGFPGGRVPDDSDAGGNLGLTLVRTLAAQLAGSLEFRGEGGVRCTLVFSTPKAEAHEPTPDPPPVQGTT